jgi:N utilization substance protein A
VPEILDGVVEIKAVAREPGHRSKIAVVSHDRNVDPVGACVGSKGARVRMVMNELRGEKIDIIKWTDDQQEFVANALSPAKVKEVRLLEDGQTALVIVPDYQLSLAIGKEGQNARLAARLTGLRVDIKSESQIRAGEEVATQEAAAEAEEAAGEADAAETPSEEAPAEESAETPAQ